MTSPNQEVLPFERQPGERREERELDTSSALRPDLQRQCDGRAMPEAHPPTPPKQAKALSPIGSLVAELRRRLASAGDDDWVCRESVRSIAAALTLAETRAAGTVEAMAPAGDVLRVAEPDRPAASECDDEPALMNVEERPSPSHCCEEEPK